MPSLQRIECGQIAEGVCFDAPVFFDDGVNMFLAANRPAKRYHLLALRKWNVPFLLTAGQQTEAAAQDAVPAAGPGEAEPLEELADAGELEEVAELEAL